MFSKVGWANQGSLILGINVVLLAFVCFCLLSHTHARHPEHLVASCIQERGREKLVHYTHEVLCGCVDMQCRLRNDSGVIC